jgi:Zn-dependent M28 family amino/carboxypeptidase
MTARDVTRLDTTLMRRDIEFLAHPRLDGRAAGAPGADTAANFIARRFADLGLSAAFDGSCARGQSEPCPRSYLQLFDTRGLRTVNIGAIVPGTDSTRRRRFIVLTAHFDHLGRGSAGKLDRDTESYVHPGADDNASGTAAILELARRFIEQPLPQSVLVVAFGAEELGLVGSRVFVEHPPIDPRDITLVVNLDMVGRLTGSRLVIYGADGWIRSLAVRANEPPRFALTTLAQSSGRSDDYPFSARGVTAVHITTGEHGDYHRAGDTAARIQMPGLARVVDYAERLVRLASTR